MRMKEVHFRNPIAPPQYCPHGNCLECLGARIKALPRLARLQIVKSLSDSNINKFLEGGLLLINGLQFFERANYGDHLQLELVRRLKVVDKVGIATHELYLAEDGHTKFSGRVLSGARMMAIHKAMGTKYRPEYAHEV